MPTLPVRRLAAVTVLVALFVLAGRAPAQSTGNPGSAEFATREGAPPAVVQFWGRHLATLRATARGMEPAERRAVAESRLDRLANTTGSAEVHVDSVRFGTSAAAMVTVHGQIVLTLFEDDLEPDAADTPWLAAQRAAGTLREALDARDASRRTPLIIRGIVNSLLATLALALALLVLGRLARMFAAQATRVAQKRSGPVLVVMTSVERVMQRATMPIAWLAGAALVYVWITFVFGQFPYTEVWGEQLGRFLWTVVLQVLRNIVGAVPGLITMGVIFIAARLGTRASSRLFNAVERGLISIPGVHPDTADATHRILSSLIWVLALVASYPHIPGSETDAFKAVGVLSGLVVSLGSVGLINQVMSGLVIVYSRALKPGEFIRTGSIYGVVQEVGLLATKIMTALREEITVPNAVLVSSEVTNYTRLAARQGAVVATSVGIGYDAPWRLVHAMLQRAAARTRLVLKEPEPIVLQRALSDFAVNYELRVTIARPEERFVMLSELHANIQDEFNANHIQIMTPAFEGQPENDVLVPKEKWNPPLAPDDASGAS